MQSIFGRLFVKRFALCYRTVLGLSCPVFNVGALWPNGWMDQDQTWHAGRPQPWPNCVRWGSSSSSPKGAQPPQFSAHICYGQMAAWIKMFALSALTLLVVHQEEHPACKNECSGVGVVCR